MGVFSIFIRLVKSQERISDVFCVDVRGGFSVVLKATHKDTGDVFAVKVIKKNVNEEDIELLKREIAIMRTIKHKHILRLHEIYEDDEHVYIIMELYLYGYRLILVLQVLSCLIGLLIRDFTLNVMLLML